MCPPCAMNIPVLVEKIIAKYSIDISDIYNLDDTGFMKGKISTGMVVTIAVLPQAAP